MRRSALLGLGDANDITFENVTAAQSTAWYNLIGQWENQATAFQTALTDLQSQNDAVQATGDPNVLSDYADLLQKGSDTLGTIQNIEAALADVKAALSGAWDSITGAWQQVSGAVSSAVATYVGTPSNSEDFVTAVQAQPIAGWGLRGLGFLPLIPIAIVAAALAAITIWLTNYSEFNQRMAAYTQAVTANPNMTAAQKSQLSQQLGLGQSGGITSTLGTLVWIAAGIAALIFLPRLISNYRTVLK
jgi:hypothetical protein